MVNTGVAWPRRSLTILMGTRGDEQRAVGVAQVV
jgi:hypothetical protein